MQTMRGFVPRVASSLSWHDLWGIVKARCGIGRMHYTLDPGLYAIGQPDSGSPVVVTANYRMSFDLLRASLHGRDLWILVLDTKGINVWCAAGKGTFGTAELLERMNYSGLSQLITHRDLILPQLAGPGVSALAIKKLSGFNVVYGPIRAKDLPAFLDAGSRATPAMRLKTFTVTERLELVPVELIAAFKTAVFVLPVLFFLGGLGNGGSYWQNAFVNGFSAALACLCGIFSGSVVTPLLLPWLPGRAFSLKGLFSGLGIMVVILALSFFHLFRWSDRFEVAAWLLFVPTISSYLAMNFTGASTYTSLSGVRKEMRWALPLQITAGIIGFSLWIVSLWIR